MRSLASKTMSLVTVVLAYFCNFTPLSCPELELADNYLGSTTVARIVKGQQVNEFKEAN